MDIRITLHVDQDNYEKAKELSNIDDFTSKIFNDALSEMKIKSNNEDDMSLKYLDPTLLTNKLEPINDLIVSDNLKYPTKKELMEELKGIKKSKLSRPIVEILREIRGS